MEKKIISIYTPYIKLDQLLKLSGEYETGGQAKEDITGGLILVNGNTELQRGKKIHPGDKVLIKETEYEVISE